MVIEIVANMYELQNSFGTSGTCIVQLLKVYVDSEYTPIANETLAIFTNSSITQYYQCPLAMGDMQPIFYLNSALGEIPFECVTGLIPNRSPLYLALSVQ